MARQCCRDDIRICHNAEGKKCKLGEGGFGVVYKALMNGVDEVAVKLVKADKPTQKEMSLFHKEVSHPSKPTFNGLCCSRRQGAVYFWLGLLQHSQVCALSDTDPK